MSERACKRRHVEDGYYDAFTSPVNSGNGPRRDESAQQGNFQVDHASRSSSTLEHSHQPFSTVSPYHDHPQFTQKNFGSTNAVASLTAPQNSFHASQPAQLHLSHPEACYGMFPVTTIKVSPSEHSAHSLHCFSVDVRAGIIYNALNPSQDTTHVSSKLGQILCGRSRELLARLAQSTDVSLEFYCRAMPCASQRKASPSKAQLNHQLVVNVFGSSQLSERFGTFFGKIGIHLQDPIVCSRDVPYENPHLLAEDDSVVMTSSVIRKTDTEEFVPVADIFDSLLTTDGLPEAETPALLQTQLLVHQKQALYFFLQNENVTTIGDSPRQMWTVGDRPAEGYTNTITGQHQRPRPDEFFGGLLADQMGLGKTLQMISLLAWDYNRNPADMPPPSLVIVPPSLLETWLCQMKEHLKFNALRWLVYHGKDREKLWNSIPHCNVVFTTYETVVKDYQKHKSSHHPTPILTLTWRRIVLDEAHSIKNAQAMRTHAICSINARSRWAVTGTPIQNRLTDFATLIKFLRVGPLDDMITFDEQIVRPWKAQSDKGAVDKLRRLVKAIAIRRSKTVLNLPTREDQIHYVDFDESERALYESVLKRVQKSAVNERSSTNVSEKSGVLQWIHDLRALCSYGSPDDALVQPLNRGHQSALEAQAEVADTEQLLGPEFLSANTSVSNSTEPTPWCGILEETGMSIDDFGPSGSDLRSNRQFRNGFVSLPDTHGWFSPSPSDASGASQVFPSSTKVQTLLTDVLLHDGKCVIFSFWCRSLDLISQAFELSGVQFSRVDGTKSIKNREIELIRFRTDPGVKVLLATISAAGVGLDLTVANLACLFEPQWNPSAEEQALSRVHRMRQMRHVKMIRYVVRDSIEENIIELQQRKLRLAQLALSGEATPLGSALLEDLKFLLK